MPAFTIFVSIMVRKILHIDMDAFFASVEQRDNPELMGKPIVVGQDGERGVVSTASYEARKYGVHSAQSIFIAKKLCPCLTIVPCRHEYYKEVSMQIHHIFREYTDLIEPISIDEAFLDVTENKKGKEMAIEIAQEIKQRIHSELSLTASAGVSYNKFLAKVASDYRKPDGLCVVHPEKALDFIAKLPVESFWGIGRKTAERMHSMGIFTGLQLREVSCRHLEEVFGKMGRIYYDFSHGVDERPVEISSIRKSVGCERTFDKDIDILSMLLIELYHITLELVERIVKVDFEGKTLTLKVKYGDFSQISKRITVDNILKTKEDILPLAKKLLSMIEFSSEHPIRLMGLTVSNPQDVDGTNEHQIWTEGKLNFADMD